MGNGDVIEVIRRSKFYKFGGEVQKIVRQLLKYVLGKNASSEWRKHLKGDRARLGND